LTNIKGGLKADPGKEQELPFTAGMVFNKCWNDKDMAFLSKKSLESGYPEPNFTQDEYWKYWYNVDVMSKGFFSEKDLADCPDLDITKSYETWK
jgi:hypothetical protein